MQWDIFVKYFLHGIIFSVFFLVLEFIWTFVIILLVGLGFIIGFIIGMGLLFLIVGFINMSLGFYLWNIETEMGFWNIFFQGLALSMTLLLIGGLITYFLPTYVFSGIGTLMVTFILRTFLNGFIGKYVASWFGQMTFERTDEEEDQNRTEEAQFEP